MSKDIIICGKMLSMENFGDWLLSELDKRKMSQADLANQTRLNRGTISNIINGTKGVGHESLTLIARALRLPVEVVFRAAGLLPPQTDEDPWVEEMSHNLGKLTGARRAIAESLVRSLIEQEEKEAQPAAAHKATQPR